MALDKITSQSLEAGAVTITALPDGVISAAKLHTTAISDKLGYTPVSPTDLAVKVDTTTVNNALALKVGIDSSSGAATIPSGTTAQRPISPTIGMVRHNTTLGYFEVYNGNVWIQAQQAPYVIEYLVVAGGASSGGGQTGLGGGGGGGAGGYIASSTTFTVGSNHTVTIGAGGAAIAQNTLSYGNAGGNSTLGSLATAIGGGGGGYGSGGAGGQAGGSGGGGGYNGYNNANNGGAGTSGQGYAGGGVSSVSASGGGGGGAGGVGSTNTGSGGGSGGVGGAGVTWLNGSTYSRGGYGGSNSMPTSEAANSGNGGNGVYNGSASQGAGGSGIVVLRYAGGQRGTGGSITSSGGYTYHTFTSSGTFTT